MGNISRWLDVEVGTDDIHLHTLGSNLALVDLNNDNEYKLVVGDFGRGDERPLLRVFKGVTQVADVVLPDIPLGVTGFYTSEVTPRSPSVIAVAFSSSVYMYRNLKVHYKYYVPSVEVCAAETDVWKQLTDESNHNAENLSKLIEDLTSIPAASLTSISQQFLRLDMDHQLEYLEQCATIPTRKPPEITCMASLKLHSVDKYAASCLVVGTEDGDVIVLDPQSFAQMYQAKICEVKKTPYQMVTLGLYSVDYRILVATREKSVCVVKRGMKEGRILLNTEEHIIALEVLTTDNSIVVICTDNTIACYSKKGTKQWSLSLEHRPVALTLLPILHLGLTLVGVALASGHVQLYDGKALVDTMFVREVVSDMKFGQLGQEEHVLIIVTANGNLMLKILKRTADFHTPGAGLEPARSTSGPASSQRPWLIPKKSKLFLEQSMRERENAIAMHERFQHELTRLRLTAAKILLESYSRGDNSVGAGALEPITLSAEVEGLGPVFRVTLLVENTSPDKAVTGLSILFHLHNTSYKVTVPYIKVPLLAPGSTLKFPTKVEEIFEGTVNPDVYFRTVTGQGGERSLVKILLLKTGRPGPVLAATVQMPPTDPLMVPFDKLADDEGFA